jgi:hypothetical protein
MNIWLALTFWAAFALLDVRAHQLTRRRLKVRAGEARFGYYYRTLTSMDSFLYDLPGGGIVGYFRFGR